MKTSMSARLRRIWLNVHLWIGVGLAVLLVPIGLSGSFLVWHDAIDPWLYPARYAVSAGDRTLPASEYVASASKALGANLAPVVVRFPEGKSSPVTVQARETGGGRGSRPRVLTAYLDPANGRVPEVARRDCASTLGRSTIMTPSSQPMTKYGAIRCNREMRAWGIAVPGSDRSYASSQPPRGRDHYAWQLARRREWSKPVGSLQLRFRKAFSLDP